MLGKIRLLIVDDELKFLDSIAKRLELRDFEITKATNGEQALEIARKERFDLVLLDLKMPGLNGKQVLEILKKEHKYLEVIILTGHGSLDSAVECTRLGAFDYLPKPYELEHLLEKLQKAYEARLQKKFEADQERLEKIAELATGNSALGILRELRKLDDEEK
ncbi:MAG: response regulator [candidate division Zixibacteria bacterium]|nr:response regulator [candidate division Zixibacteria bacterium]MBU1469917.1 response regulator [candidate division Zixibacteria bacterium]MBU2624064.1 response regulator [candidate division Zixibacteria bacterium]